MLCLGSMRFFRRPSPPPPNVTQQELEVAVFLTEARRLLDYHWRRGDAFERKALGVLALTGVIATLLPATIATVLSLHDGFRVAALILGAVAIVSLLGGAVAAAGVLWARAGKSVNVVDIRSSWADHIGRMESGEGYSDLWHANQLQRNLVEMLLHGSSAGTSPVQSVCDDANRRGAWFGWSVRFVLCTLILMLCVTVVTTWGKL